MTLSVEHMLQERYRVISPLGEGGMGAVYRAWDTRLDVAVALKEMVPQPGLDAQTEVEMRAQFKQEAMILARLDHPSLVDVIDFFEEEGNVYLVMKFIKGESLAERIQREGALPEGDVLAWAEQLLDALAYCHSQGIIHRDVKPQNVVIRPDDQAVLVDFGLVKLWDPKDPRTKTAMRGMGTPEYAPPEQYEVEAGHTDARSDIYSLGATMYHAIVGDAPPTATLRIATPEQFTPPEELKPGVSEQTNMAIVKALKLVRSERWQSAADMASALNLSVPEWEEEGIGEKLVSTLIGRGGTLKMESGDLSRRKAILGDSRTWRRVGRFLWQATKWTLGKLAAVIVVLAIVAIVLAIGSSFVLSSVLEQALASQNWHWENWEGNRISVVMENELQESLGIAVEPYALGSLSELTADLQPPDVVTVEGYLRERQIHLRGRLATRDGVPRIGLEKLNGVPLYVVGGIISNGINQGLQSAWEDAPMRMVDLEVHDDRIQIELEPDEGSSRELPTSTPATAVVHIVNRLTYEVVVTIDGEILELDAGGETEIVVRRGAHSYRITAGDQLVADGEVSWNSSYQEWTIRD